MSLFKVRDFWSFDLGQLSVQYGCSATSSSAAAAAAAADRAPEEAQSSQADLDPNERRAGNFIVAQGRFHSVGHHDVFVCADLIEGLVLVVQVPELEQLKLRGGGGGSALSRGHASRSPSRSPERGRRGQVEAVDEGEGQAAEEAAADEGDGEEPLREELAGSSRSGSAFKDRQLLVAKRLGFPIVDLKCGYFTSALKQSIAVLGFDKIVIFQLKRHQVDLLTADSPAGGGGARPASLDENLFSHELEEHCRLELLASTELASNLVVLSSHADEPSNHHHRHHKDLLAASSSSLAAASSSSAAEGNTGAAANKYAPSNHKLKLPQRDSLVVQYTNQFVLTLVEYKKIVGHYTLVDSRAPFAATSAAAATSAGTIKAAAGDHHESHLQQLARFIGPMPAAYVRDGAKGSASLVVALSDNRIYSLSLAKMITLARQNVMKRVALDLLHDNNSSSSSNNNNNNNNNKGMAVAAAVNQLMGNTATGSHGKQSALASYDRAPDSERRIEIELESGADWTVELACAPIQMLAVLRRHSLGASNSQLSSSTTTGNGSCLSGTGAAEGQLLVMSRYNLDLFTNLGQHVWSQRFEAPLICLHTYVLAGSASPLEASQKSSTSSAATATATAAAAPASSLASATADSGADRMLTLLCTDCLSADKCNLLVLDEDRIVWSALLNTKPLQLWRANLGKLSGALVALDVNQGHLSASYLGTNKENDEQELLSEAQQSGDELASLELLDAPLFPPVLGDAAAAADPTLGGSGFESRKLKVDIRLEAFDQWPNVYVKSDISIVPVSPNVLQNILVTIEFDDLIYFEPAAANCDSASYLSEGAVQVALGSCWPDRREPMTLAGRFALRSSQQQQLDGDERGSASASDRDKDLNGERDGVGAPSSAPTASLPTSNWSAKVAAGASYANQSSLQQQAHQQRSSSLINLMPKSLKVRLYFRFNEANLGSSLQEESFLLPLNIVARLIHIDYSSGQNQSLEDVQANLNPYGRPAGTNFNSATAAAGGGGGGQSSWAKSQAAAAASVSPYYLCDLFVRTGSDLIELVDEIIESDLICRGLNCESMKYKLEGQRAERKLSTLENINLLAQSLDCRLKYKSFSHPASGVLRQSSEDYSPAVLVSIALKIFNGSKLIESDLIVGSQAKQKAAASSSSRIVASPAAAAGPFKSSAAVGNEANDLGDFSIIWLHLCDLAASESVIPGELIGQHLKEWKAHNDGQLASDFDFDYDDVDNGDQSSENAATLASASTNQSDDSSRPILVSIECDHPMPVLFLQSHLLERLKKRSKRPNTFYLNTLADSAYNSIEMSYQNILKMNNFIAISVNFHDRLSSAICRYQSEFVSKFERLKEELRREYYKFHVITLSSLSLAKRLFKLPDHMHKQFSTISQLTKQYQLNLTRILIELEKLKLSDYQFSKIPEASDILLEINGKKGLSRWPNISQIID